MKLSYLPATAMISLLSPQPANSLRNCRLYSRLDSRYEALVSTVEADLLRLYLVTAHSAKRPEKIAEFFKVYGPQLLSNSNSNNNSSSSSSSYRSGMGPEGCTDWREWFLLPYLQHPEREQRFQVLC